MKHLSLSFLLLLGSVGFHALQANNLSITNLTIVDANNLQFDISWDNSWYVAGSPTMYDAVWIFVKAQDCAGSTTWDHTNLSTTPANFSVTGGTGLSVEVSSDGKGVFVRRNSNGFGTQSGTVTLRFASAMPAFATINYQVFGIEMAWIPAGSFQVGDGSSSNTAGAGSAHSFGTSNTTAPYSITSEAAIAANAFQNDRAGIGCGGNTPDYAAARNLALGAAFPKGYAGYYCMKYEISQSQYVAFLNTLTNTQQASRTAASTTAATGTYAMTNTGTALNRNSIVLKTPATATTVAVYDCDLNGDAGYGDGGDIACNYLSWADLDAYLDWSALRPMSELEYEKTCRGPLTPVNREYVWGSTSVTPTGSLSLNNAGTSTEYSTIEGPGLASMGSAAFGTGPLRTGFAATATTGRSGAGGGYYGVFDMAGNVWEQCIQTGWSYVIPLSCVSYTTYPSGGIIFTGINGDGSLDISGNSDIATWGSSNYSILKGGSWNQANNAAGLQKLQISDRSMVYNLTSYANASRSSEIGGRGVRKP